MSKSYRCLSFQDNQAARYKLVPIRDEDKYSIMEWRNDQIDILRQRHPLTKEDQELYFKNVVAQLFEVPEPDQILFSFLEDGFLIGYGGLVHIDWESRNAEISFITETSRSHNPKLFIQDWKAYLSSLKTLIRANGLFAKIYTYAYDMRPFLYEALLQSFFTEEARLRDHVLVRKEYRDVLIHAYFFEDLVFRRARMEDLMLFFEWANDSKVRMNSFNESTITLEKHEKWFKAKICSPETVMLVALKKGKAIGQLRFDPLPDGTYEIDFSVDKNHRGQNIGRNLLRTGTEHFFQIRPDAKNVVGKVKAFNIPSIKSFEKMGFKRIDTEGSRDVVHYCLHNPSI